MTTPADRIYKNFKKLNILDLVYEKNARRIRYVIVIMVALTTFFYFKYFNTPSIVLLIIFGASIIAFLTYTDKKFNKKFNNQLEVGINVRKEGVNYISLKLLFNTIKEEKLNSKDGIKYLIEIYEKKRKSKKINTIISGAVVASAIVNNFFYVVFMGKGEDWSRLKSYYLAVNGMYTIICGFIAFLLILYFLMKYQIREFKEIKHTLFGEDYNKLIEYLEYHILPMVLSDNKENFKLNTQTQQDVKTKTNKNRKQNSKINLVVLLTAFIVLLPICFEYNASLDKGQWASFIGSYLGGAFSGIAGLVAVLLTILQNKALQKENLEMQERHELLEIKPFAYCDMEEIIKTTYEELLINSEVIYFKNDNSEKSNGKLYFRSNIKICNVGQGIMKSLRITNICINENEDILVNNENQSIIKDILRKDDEVIKAIILKFQYYKDKNNKLSFLLEYNDLLDNSYEQEIIFELQQSSESSFKMRRISSYISN